MPKGISGFRKVVITIALNPKEIEFMNKTAIHMGISRNEYFSKLIQSKIRGENHKRGWERRLERLKRDSGTDKGTGEGDRTE